MHMFSREFCACTLVLCDVVHGGAPVAHVATLPAAGVCWGIADLTKASIAPTIDFLLSFFPDFVAALPDAAVG